MGKWLGWGLFLKALMSITSITIPTRLSPEMLNDLTCYCMKKDKISTTDEKYKKGTNNGNGCTEHKSLPKSWNGKPKVVMYVPLEIAKLYCKDPKVNPNGKVSRTINTAQFFFWAEEYGVDNLKVGYKIRMSCGNRLCVNPEHMELLDNEGNVIHHSDNVEKELEIIETERPYITDMRIGQAKLRAELIDKYGKCHITKIGNHKFLKASHIRPWKDSNDDQKLDIDNVLLLEARWDNLFNYGLITFDRDGKIEFSSQISKEERKILQDELSKFDSIPMNEKREEYLKFHRDKIFEE